MPAMRQRRRRTFGGGAGGDGPEPAGRVRAAGIPGAATASNGVPIATAVDGVPDATAGIGVPDATTAVGVSAATGPGLSFASAATTTPPPPPAYPNGPQQGPPPGYSGQRRPTSRSSGSWDSTGDDSSIEDAVAGIVMGAATKFIGRAIGRRVKRAYEERVVPAMAAKQEAMLREQIAIAERHPDLRACLTDQVVFLAGGSRVLPMAGLIGKLTVEQSDALVAQLRGG